jgi:hypothetical protein
VFDEITLERFWSKVAKADSASCWEWQGSQRGQGYGVFHTKQTGSIGAHRVAYMAVKGEVPENYQLDHLCRNRACCNPDHLEPVTSKVNTLRGVGPTAVNSAKTHCIRGHRLDAPHVRIKRKADGVERVCRLCHNANVRASRQRKAALASPGDRT